MGTVGSTVIEERPGAFERERDPATIRYLEDIGVFNGWRCLEVGGGGDYSRMAMQSSGNRRASSSYRLGYPVIGCHRFTEYLGAPSRHRE